MDCMASLDKTKGDGVCFLINTSWCSDVATLASHCCLDLEYFTVKCHPYYLPREYSSVTLIAVYIPPHTDVTNVLDMIYTATNKHTRDEILRVLIHRGWQRQPSQPQAADNQQLKRENHSRKVVQCWSEAEDWLWDSLGSVDWTLFKCSVEKLNEYATTVKGFISKCVEDCVPKKTIQVFPNWKPWMNQEIHSLLKTRHVAFKT
eukprot:g46402.t1